MGTLMNQSTKEEPGKIGKQLKTRGSQFTSQHWNGG